MLATEYALTQPDNLISLILSSPVISAPRYVQDANGLKRELPIEMQAAIEQHEAAGTTETPEYKAAFLEWMRLHISRNPVVLEGVVNAFSDPVTGINGQVYNTMWGPSEFTCNGNLKDFDRTARLPEITLPTLFTCGRYDECTPAATNWYHSLMPGSEIVVFENSAHMVHLEETEYYLQTIRDFLRRVEDSLTSSSATHPAGAGWAQARGARSPRRPILPGSDRNRRPIQGENLATACRL